MTHPADKPRARPAATAAATPPAADPVASKPAAKPPKSGTQPGTPPGTKPAAKAPPRPRQRIAAGRPSGGRIKAPPVTPPVAPTRNDAAGAGTPSAAAPARRTAAPARAGMLDAAAASPEARVALAWTHTARFLTTASQLSQLPPPGLPEVAFVGRSNAGKSTAINMLAQQRQLAYASKTPGRTQHINLFNLGPVDAPDQLWADLPGYGFATVARVAKLRWQQVMADYLDHRHALAGVVMMVDSRHGFTPLDLQLLAFVMPRVSRGEVKLLVLLTKADKLGRQERTLALAKAQAQLGEQAGEAADIGVALFSALNREGVADAAELLYTWRAEPAAGADTRRG